MSVREMVGGLIPPTGPVRVLVWSMLGRSIAYGILLSVVVLFFTRSVHISAAELGVGLSVAAILKILVSVPAGHLTDRMGSRRAAIVFVVLEGVLVASYALADGFIGFLVTASLVGMADSASEAARGALIAGVVPAEGRVRTRAYLKSVDNIGIALGSVLGGVALSLDTRMFYSVLLVACGALFVVGGLVYIALPPVQRIPRPEGGRNWEALRDPQYMAFGLINAILVMNTGILAVALPLWIVERTSAPAAMYSVILVLNTVIVVLFQVRASRGSEDVRGGARALARCGVLLAACCGLFALAGGQPVWLAVALLSVGAVVHVFGELLYSAGTWALAYELAPEHAQGQYQGVFVMTTNLGNMLTPVLVTALIIGTGSLGWLAFAAAMVGAGLAAPAVGRWALSTRSVAVPQPD
jgi:MFS family permease